MVSVFFIDFGLFYFLTSITSNFWLNTCMYLLWFVSHVVYFYGVLQCGFSGFVVSDAVI